MVDALHGLRGGFFLDSGASNGLSGSNTGLLESAFGWTGICVEPNAAFFAELVRNRRCICLNCCLYDREGTVDFLEAAGVYGGIVAEYEAGHLQFARTVAAAPPELPSTTLKPARTVRSVLRECAAPSVIDYWSLDTEGSELAILRSFPFDEYRFRVLTVEHNYAPAREEIREFLEGHGYARAGSLGIDDCYLHGDELGNQAWQSHAWSRHRTAEKR